VKKILFDKPELEATNAIKEELRTFGEAIVNDTATVVTLEDGFWALDVAQQVLDKLKMSGSLVSDNIQV